MPDEADLGEALNRAKGMDELLNLLCEALAHFEEIPFGLILVGRGGQKEGLWVREGQIVLQDAHVHLVALETMHQDEQVHADHSRLRSPTELFGWENLLLSEHLCRVLEVGDELRVFILHIAFFEYNRVQIDARPENALVFNFELIVIF